MSCANLTSTATEPNLDIMCTNPADTFMDNRHTCCDDDSCADDAATADEVCEYTPMDPANPWEMPSCCDIAPC